MNAVSTNFSICPSNSQNPRVFKKSRVLASSSDHSSIEVSRVSYRPPGPSTTYWMKLASRFHRKGSCSFGLIFGRSGSGKTTLLQVLAGFSKPTSGSIYVQKYGNDGNPYILLELLPPERIGHRIPVSREVGLNSIPLDEDPHSLSGGYKRRLALAIQSVKKPDLLLLDEPWQALIGKLVPTL